MYSVTQTLHVHMYLYMYNCTCTYIHVIFVPFYIHLSLCKMFSQYAFLWEQGVILTFNSGVAEPYPRHFTHPETVCRSRSASHIARPRRYLVMHNVFSVSSTHSSS